MGGTTAEVLLAAICAEPDDDGPRLVYSDWLEEQGDVERAEFIRAGCRRARLEAWHADWSMLAWRERVLLARHERSWRAELPKIEGVTWGSFERGFVHEVSAASPGVLAAWAGDIVRAVPVRWATLGGTSSDWESCAPLPFLKGLQFVHVPIFEANLGFLNCTALDRNPDSVFQSPLLSTLTALDLSSFDIREEQLGALARSPYLANLRTLVLDRSVLDPGNLRLLLSSAISRNLTTLRLRGCQWKNGQGGHEYGLGQEAVALLAESENLAGLTSLDLGGERGHGRLAASLAEVTSPGRAAGTGPEAEPAGSARRKAPRRGRRADAPAPPRLGGQPDRRRGGRGTGPGCILC